jgi:hypothetical protein
MLIPTFANPVVDVSEVNAGFSCVTERCIQVRDPLDSQKYTSWVSRGLKPKINTLTRVGRNLRVRIGVERGVCGIL